MHVSLSSLSTCECFHVVIHLFFPVIKRPRNKRRIKVKQIHGVLYFSYSLHPTQPFFYITQSGFSHLKRRLLHLPACLSLRPLELSKPLSPVSCCGTEREREEEGEERGRKEKKKRSRNESLSPSPSSLSSCVSEYGGDVRQNKGMLSPQTSSGLCTQRGR